MTLCSVDAGRTKFKIYATSGQFSLKGAVAASIGPCVVPYWQKTDLEAAWMFARIAGDFEKQYFVSGSTLRELLMDPSLARKLVDRELSRARNSSHAETLLSGVGIASVDQVDNLCSLWLWHTIVLFVISQCGHVSLWRWISHRRLALAS